MSRNSEPKRYKDCIEELRWEGNRVKIEELSGRQQLKKQVKVEVAREKRIQVWSHWTHNYLANSLRLRLWKLPIFKCTIGSISHTKYESKLKLINAYRQKPFILRRVISIETCKRESAFLNFIYYAWSVRCKLTKSLRFVVALLC